MKSLPPTQPRPPASPPNPRPPSGPTKQAEILHPVTELAALWRCSADHIYDLIAKGELRSVSLGTGRAKTRIPASAADEFVRQRTKGRAA